MNVQQAPMRTADLIREAAETRRQVVNAVDELKIVREQIAETVRYARWLRFLDYDLNAVSFVENLDLRKSQ